jgi:hypothetical protein
MTVFDILDRIAALSVGVILNEPVVWRPMRAAAGSTFDPTPGGSPDDERPVRHDLQAIASWQPTGIPVDGGQPGTVGEGTLLVDFAAATFEGPGMSYYGKPRAKDRLELPSQAPSDRLVQIDRVGDDGSERFYCWCSVLSG